MKPKRGSSNKVPASKRVKTAPKPVDVDPARAPADLEQYIGTFDDIAYDQARRWCAYFGRKGRGGNLEALKEWLKDKYDRKGKAGLDKPNGLGPGFTPTEDWPESKRCSPRRETPGSRCSSVKAKSPESTMPDGREGKTADTVLVVPSKELPVEEPPAEEDDIAAAERVSDVWRLIQTAASILMRDHNQEGVQDALGQLDIVLYETLAAYDSATATRRLKRERRRKAQEAMDSVLDDDGYPGGNEDDESPTYEVPSEIDYPHSSARRPLHPQEKTYRRAREGCNKALAKAGGRYERMEPEALREDLGSETDNLKEVGESNKDEIQARYESSLAKAIKAEREARDEGRQRCTISAPARVQRMQYRQVQVKSKEEEF